LSASAGCSTAEIVVLLAIFIPMGKALHCAEEARVQIAGTALSLEPTIAQTIAIIVHELATNAAKYGALSVAEGHIKIEWSRSFDRLLILRWTETLGPLVKPPAHRGFGTRVMGTWCATNSRARCASIGGQKDLHAKSPIPA
jgi:two-component sensor histidine kinase